MPSDFLLQLLLFPFLSCLRFPADTKRKVEQISEELRSLDEMLAGNEGGEGAVEVTAEEASPAPSEDSDPAGSDRKGLTSFKLLWLFLNTLNDIP